MIIVEGPDGSGKSTLVTRLAQVLKLPVASKVVTSDTQPIVDLRKWTEDNVHKGFQPVIFDRHRLISEPIYGPVIRARQHGEFYDVTWLSDMMWHFYNSKPIVIYCLPDILTVRENVAREDTDNAVVKDHIAAIYAGYVARASMDFTRGLGKLYNYKTSRFDDLVGWVNMNLEGRITNHDRVRFPNPRNEVHSSADHGGRRTTGRRSSH